MSTSYTDLLRLADQGTGDNPTTWGDIADAAINMLEDAIAGMATVNTTGGTVTLSTANNAVDEARMAIIKITGALVSNSTIVVPTSTKHYIIWNATTGAYTLTVKPTAGTGIAVAQGYSQSVFCDGVNVLSVGLPAVTGDITIAGTVATIADNAVTYAKMQNVSATSKLLGRSTAGAGDPEEIALSAALSVSGGTLKVTECLAFALGDESTALTTGTKVTFRMPYAFTLASVRASLTTASSSGLPDFDVKMDGATVFSTRPTINVSAKTTVGATTASVLAASPTTLTDDAEMTLSVVTAGTGAAGAKIYLLGSRA